MSTGFTHPTSKKPKLLTGYFIENRPAWKGVSAHYQLTCDFYRVTHYMVLTTDVPLSKKKE